MKWLHEGLRIFRRAGIRVSVAPIWGSRGPAVALIREGVSWEQIQAEIQPAPAEQLEAV